MFVIISPIEENNYKTLFFSPKLKFSLSETKKLLAPVVNIPLFISVKGT